MFRLGGCPPPRRAAEGGVTALKSDAHSSSRLEVRLLGSFDVRHNGKPLVFRSSRERELFAFLLLSSQRSHARSSLAYLLWPDLAEESAMRNLRKTLHWLKRALADGGHAIGDRTEGQPIVKLLADRQQVELAPDDTRWVDVLEIKDKAATVETHTHRSVRACRSCGELAAAVEKIAGGELLQGLFSSSQAFDGWLRAERESIRTMTVGLLTERACYLLATGQMIAAERCARKVLAIEPWSEQAHVVVVSCVAAGGDRGAALRQAESAVASMQSELGADPGPELSELIYRLRHNISPRDQHLPLPADTGTRFIGRRREMEEIDNCLAGVDDRVITITGMGGVGKTRLALEVSRQQLGSWKDGVAFVELDRIREGQDLLVAVADSLGISLGGPLPVEERLADFLHSRELLLVLDNCEHQVAAVQQLAVFVRKRSPSTRLLCTSREPLGLAWERVLSIEGLTLSSRSDDLDDTVAGVAGRGEALQLFAAVAERYLPGALDDGANLAVAEEIVRATGGLPLAIEIAAGALRNRSLGEVLRAANGVLADLRSPFYGTPERQASIGRVISDSLYDLDENERRSALSLSVFVGSFALERAVVVTGLTRETAGRLLDRSLLRREGGDRVALHPLVRQKFREQLPASQYRVARDAHAREYLAALADGVDVFFGSAPSCAIEGVVLVIDDIRSAWNWAVDSEDHGLLSDSAGGLLAFCDITGRHALGKELFAHGTAVLAERRPLPGDSSGLEALLKGAESWFRWRLWQGAIPARQFSDGEQYRYLGQLKEVTDSLALGSGADPSLECLLRAGYGVASAVSGDHRTAREQAGWALRIGQGGAYTAAAFMNCAVDLICGGDPRLARDDLVRLTGDEKQRMSWGALVCEVHAWLAAALGDAPGVRLVTLEASKLYSDAGNNWDAARCCFQSGADASRRQWIGLADELLREAARLLDGQDSAAAAAECWRLLGELPGAPGHKSGEHRSPAVGVVAAATRKAR